MTIIQQPTNISLSGNMLPFIITSGSLVNFTLKDGADVLIQDTYEPDTTGRVTIDVKDIIESRLKYKMQAQAFYEQTEIVKQFTATIDSETVTFKAIRAGVRDLADTPTNWLTGNFLTWQPQQKPITYYSPEWLTYYAPVASTIKLKAYFPGKAEQIITLGSCQAGKAFTSNVQYAHIAGLLNSTYPTHFDVWAETSAGARLSFIQRYYFSEVLSEQEQWFLFENSLGGLDTLRASGETDLDTENEHKVAIVDGEVQEYKIDTKQMYTKNTGHLTDYERRWLLDFPTARTKYIHHSGAIRKIAVIETDFRYAISDSPTNYTFKYRFVSQSSLLNLARSEELIPSSITVPDIDAPGFFLPPRLSELPRVTLSEGVLIPAFSPNSETPTVTSIGELFSVIIASVLGKIPGSDAGGQLINMLLENDIVAPSDTNTFSSLRTLKEIGKAITSAISNLKLDENFLSKVNPDTAQSLIKFLQGVEVGNFTPGMLGSGAKIWVENGISYLEVDNAKIRMSAEFLEIISSTLRHINGGLVLSKAGMKCNKVVEHADSWQCFFDTGENNEVPNQFIVNDQARCQIFNGSGTKFYWRLVTEVGEDWIRLSKTLGIGTDAPAIGDDIVQLGYQGNDHLNRRFAQIIDASGIKQYGGITDFTLEGKERTKITADGSTNQFYGDVVFKSASGDKDLVDFVRETETAIQDTVDKIPEPIWKVEAVNVIPNAPNAIFRRGEDEALHQLTLRAKFTRNEVDVTDLMNTSGLRLYEFERRNMWGEDDNGNSDSGWNTANLGRTEVTLTHEDIVFIGNINMVFDDEILEQEYQRLK